MTKWMRQVSEQAEQFDEFTRLHHSAVMQPLTPGKDNTDAISQYNDIQNLKRIYSLISR